VSISRSILPISMKLKSNIIDFLYNGSSYHKSVRDIKYGAHFDQQLVFK
jgi:hypothetical protein